MADPDVPWEIEDPSESAPAEEAPVAEDQSVPAADQPAAEPSADELPPPPSVIFNLILYLSLFPLSFKFLIIEDNQSLLK